MRGPSALLAVVLLAGCGVQTEQAARPLADRASPSADPSGSPALVPGSRPTTLYLVRDAVLAPVIRRTSAAGSPSAALQLLLRGPSRLEARQGLTTALGPDAVLLEQVQVRGTEVVVPLRELPAEGLVRSDEVLAYAQVVTTLTALRGVSTVVFTRDGMPLDVPRADGSIAPGPLTRRDYAALL